MLPEVTATLSAAQLIRSITSPAPQGVPNVSSAPYDSAGSVYNLTSGGSGNAPLISSSPLGTLDLSNPWILGIAAVAILGGFYLWKIK